MKTVTVHITALCVPALPGCMDSSSLFSEAPVLLPSVSNTSRITSPRFYIFDYSDRCSHEIRAAHDSPPLMTIPMESP
jgi:hypothetical protein